MIVEEPVVLTAEDERNDGADGEADAGQSDEPFLAGDQGGRDHSRCNGVEQEARTDLVDRPVPLEVQLEVHEPADEQADRGGNPERSSKVHPVYFLGRSQCSLPLATWMAQL